MVRFPIPLLITISSVCLHIALQLALIAMFPSPSVALESPAVYVDLGGTHKFQEGDQPDWASPDYDDSGWKLIKVPESWQAQNIMPDNKIGWYRIHFTALPSWQEEQPAVFFGRIGDSDEVYLNGVKIGGEGILGNKFIEATDVVRLYPLPQALLRLNNDNVLAIRIMNTYIRGGLFESAVFIGDYRKLLVRKLDDEFRRKSIQFFYLVLHALLLLFVVLRYIAGVRGKEYLLFIVFLALQCIQWTITSLSFYELGLKTHIFQRFYHAITALYPGVTVLFLSLAFRDYAFGSTKIVVTASLAVCFGYMLFMGDPKLLRSLDLLWIVIALAAIIVISVICIRAFRQRQPEFWPIIAGYGVLVISALAELLSWRSWGDYAGYYFPSPVDIGVLAMVLGIAYSMDMQFARSLRRTKVYSRSVIAAHDEERRRISFDLHDGLGQTLLALKLKMQMLSTGLKADKASNTQRLKEIAGDLDSAVAELEQISMDLRPPRLEGITIADLLKKLARSFTERTGIGIAFETSDLPERLPGEVVENLYRICQEALGNIYKHAGASSAHIAASGANGVLQLTIRDNGCGFNPATLQKDSGLGFWTMSERAEILKGSFSIRNVPEGGTEIMIEVPIP